MCKDQAECTVILFSCALKIQYAQLLYTLALYRTICAICFAIQSIAWVKKKSFILSDRQFDLLHPKRKPLISLWSIAKIIKKKCHPFTVTYIARPFKARLNLRPGKLFQHTTKMTENRTNKREAREQPVYRKLQLLRHGDTVVAGRLLVAGAMLYLWFYLALPSPLFRDDYSTVLFGADGALLGARVAGDEQWRFPMGDTLPAKYVTALLLLEDRHFLLHRGVYYPSLMKAVWDNLRAGTVKRGGSTLTMQLARISQGNPPRTIPQKVAEIILAYRLEHRYSKEEILMMYAAHAPFGSNVVGLEAASWRFFGKPPGHLSWAEHATLAVLPNNPGRVYPGRNEAQLLTQRNRLLERLAAAGHLSVESCELAMMEPLPDGPAPLPDLAPHLMNRMISEGKRGQRIHTTIDANLQPQVEEIMARHHELLSATGIHNMAVLVMETQTGVVRVYQGNVRGAGAAHGSQVDVISAPRSSGSILKPFLFAMMLNDGLILPDMLVRDIPVQIGNFRPVNYSRQYSGAVPARMALSRSLNIPAVRMLNEYGTARFCDGLRQMGKGTLTRPASHYGLSVILGGAESKLWELCGMYGSMGRTLMNYTMHDSRYVQGSFHMPEVLQEGHAARLAAPVQLRERPEVVGAGAVWLTFEAMIDVVRPEEDSQWRQFSTTRQVAWKTGTSYGNRDAWSIGVTPGYVVGVWVGNASGEGRPSLTGTTSAAPVMFDVISRLPREGWFRAPWDDLRPLAVCRHSGHPASVHCEATDTQYVCNVHLRAPVCPYHTVIHLDARGEYRVNSNCYPPGEMVHRPWFVLPPAVEYYYRPLNPLYRPLPPWKVGCAPTGGTEPVMDVIYPVDLGEIYIPVDLSGRKEQVVFEVAHRERNSKVFWYLNDAFIGTTTREHKMGLSPDEGWHTLLLTDSKGERVSRRFYVSGSR